MDTAGTFPGSQGSLDTGTKVGMREAGTALQLVNLLFNEDEVYRSEVIDFQKHCCVLYIRTACGCVCRLGLGSSSGLSAGLLLFWVRGSCPFPLSNPVSSVSSKTVGSLHTFP